VPISGIWISALLALVWRPKANQVVNAFVPHCRRAFA
jgi:hypothetical protein